MKRALPLLLLALAACISASENAPDRALPELIPGRTTRAQVVQAYGTPQVIRRRGDHTIFSYSFNRGDGSGLGVGSLVVNFVMSDTQVAMEKLDVIFGPDGKVRWVRRGGVTRPDNPGPWPFGD